MEQLEIFSPYFPYFINNTESKPSIRANQWGNNELLSAIVDYKLKNVLAKVENEKGNLLGCIFFLLHSEFVPEKSYYLVSF